MGECFLPTRNPLSPSCGNFRAQTGSSVVEIFRSRGKSKDKRGDKPVVLAGGGGRISWPTHKQTQIKTHSHTPGTKPEQEAAGVLVIDQDHCVKITCTRERAARKGGVKRENAGVWWTTGCLARGFSSKAVANASGPRAPSHWSRSRISNSNYFSR